MTLALDRPDAVSLTCAPVWQGGPVVRPVLDAYLAHCERRGFSDQTRRCYRILVTQWLDHLTSLGIEYPSAAEVEAFLDQWPSPATRATYLSWLRAYCRWCFTEGLAE